MTAAVPELRDLLVDRLADLMGGYADDDLPELIWAVSLGVVERAVSRTRGWAWWKAYPADELERLREALDEALRLAGWAAQLQVARNDAEHEEAALVRDLNRRAKVVSRRGGKV